MGKISQHLRDFLYAETGGTCIYCGRELAPGEVTLDHIVPKKGHGGKNRDNLICACSDCNNRKGAMTAREFRAMMSPMQRKDSTAASTISTIPASSTQSRKNSSWDILSWSPSGGKSTSPRCYMTSISG